MITVIYLLGMLCHPCSTLGNFFFKINGRLAKGGKKKHQTKRPLIPRHKKQTLQVIRMMSCKLTTSVCIVLVKQILLFLLLFFFPPWTLTGHKEKKKIME